MHVTILSRFVATAMALAAACLASSAAAEPLGLRETLARALAQDVGRPVSEAQVSAADAAVRQAGVKPNPALGFDIENVGGTGERRWVDSAETTVYYEQTLERGGKRAARVGAARAEATIARLKAEVRALDLIATVQGLWVEAAAADAAAELAQQRLAVAERLEAETARRVRSARDPLLAGERAKTAAALARIALDQARDHSRNADAALGAYLGLPSAQAEAAAFANVTPAETNAGTEAMARADLALLEAQRDAALARVRVEESGAVQDPTLHAGVRHFSDAGDVAFVVGGSIPLGRKESNRGNIDRALAERTAAEAELAAVRVERDREIAQIRARQAAAAAEIGRIGAEVLPSAERAVELARDGFVRGGAFTYAEVAEAQQALIDVRAHRMDLIKAYQLDGARLDRLTARYAVLIAEAQTR